MWHSIVSNDAIRWWSYYCCFLLLLMVLLPVSVSVCYTLWCTHPVGFFPLSHDTLKIICPELLGCTFKFSTVFFSACIRFFLLLFHYFPRFVCSMLVCDVHFTLCAIREVYAETSFLLERLVSWDTPDYYQLKLKMQAHHIETLYTRQPIQLVEQWSRKWAMSERKKTKWDSTLKYWITVDESPH